MKCIHCGTEGAHLGTRRCQDMLREGNEDGFRVGAWSGFIGGCVMSVVVAYMAWSVMH